MKQKIEQAQKAYQQLQAELGKAGANWGFEQIYPYPDYPEPTALPPANPVIDLHAPVPVKLALKAQVPETLKLRGRPEMLFSRAVLTLTARELNRNLALPDWGTTISDVPGGDEFFASAKEYLLPGVQRITVLAHKPDQAALFRWKDGTTWRWVYEVSRPYSIIIKPTYTVYDQAVETTAIQLHYNTKLTGVVLLSASTPSRLMLAAGDDTPLQSFPSALPAGDSAVSRDLAGDLNRAWAAAKPVGNGLVEIPLKVTSLTDGIVEVKLEGNWQRYKPQPAAEFAVNPFVGSALTVPWLASAPNGSVAVQVEAEFETARRWGLLEQMPAGRTFAVRVTENLVIAQAVLLRAGGGTGAARSLTAVWLALPSVPPEPQTVEVKLAPVVGDPVTPDVGAPLARAEATLPADTAAYVVPVAGGPAWYRVPFERPVELDGTASGLPFFLVCAGREGTLLAHRSVQSVTRLPAQPGAGSAMVRNLSWASDWEDQAFDRTPARWLFDLELAPAATEALFTIAGQSPALTNGKGLLTAVVQAQASVITLPITARAVGKLKLTAAAVAPA
ncbi:MAG TPA: hypothetical protein VNT75_20810 [Symbiobacteriaceae bacterium]|nr:hypothetical protein [Symbiobacteriaceae bacterium]